MEQIKAEEQKNNHFEMLEELLWQDQFELIFPEKTDNESESTKEKNESRIQADTFTDKNESMQRTGIVIKKSDLFREETTAKSEIRLVYLMNDAVESFLVFVNAKMTGQYQADYEGELEAELSREDTENDSTYVLVVHQGDSVVTLFFEDLKVETHLYRYGDLGHFWVKGYEYLRQLEYRLAILHTKCEYLGADASSEEERRLAELVHFPPLNYACYPAVPEKYIVPMDDVWEPTEQAISIMEELAEEAKDRSLLRWLAFYRKHHGKGMSRLIAWMLHRVRHGTIVDLLMEKLMHVSECYPVRTYEIKGSKQKLSEAENDVADTGELKLSKVENNVQDTGDLKLSETEKTMVPEENPESYHKKLLVQATQRKAELEVQGKQVTLVREEPFTTAQDSVEYNIYLMIWQKKWGNRIVEVEHFA